MKQMDNIEILTKVKDALQEAETILRHEKNKNERLAKQDEQIKSLKKELGEAKAKYGEADMILQAFRRTHPTTKIEICPTCGGEGGWSYCDEYGNGDGGYCEHCGGSGVIIEEMIG